MGNHGPARTPLLQRVRSKRTVVVTVATGAVLIAGGTAGAATIGDLGTDSEGADAAANDMAAPQAKVADLTAPASATPDAKQREKAQQHRDQLSRNAAQPVSGTAEREKKQQEPSTESSGDSDSESPTGEGGSCEASMYSESQPTASGEQFDPNAMTAAHKSLPMDSKVKVTNPSNGESVTVRINDRGPYVEGRCLDLSTASFEKIASAGAGVTDVEWQVVK